MVGAIYKLWTTDLYCAHDWQILPRICGCSLVLLTVALVMHKWLGFILSRLLTFAFVVWALVEHPKVASPRPVAEALHTSPRRTEGFWSCLKVFLYSSICLWGSVAVYFHSLASEVPFSSCSSVPIFLFPSLGCMLDSLRTPLFNPSSLYHDVFITLALWDNYKVGSEMSSTHGNDKVLFFPRAVWPLSPFYVPLGNLFYECLWDIAWV